MRTLISPWPEIYQNVKALWPTCNLYFLQCRRVMWRKSHCDITVKSISPILWKNANDSEIGHFDFIVISQLNHVVTVAWNLAHVGHPCDCGTYDHLCSHSDVTSAVYAFREHPQEKIPILLKSWMYKTLCCIVTLFFTI